MKVALVILHADPARGGAERYTVALASDLAAAGVEVSVLASSFASIGSNIECVPIAAAAITRAGGYLAFLHSLQRALLTARFDIVHAMLPVPRCDIYHPHAGIAAETLFNGHLLHDSPAMRAAAWLGNRLNRRRRLYAAVERRLLASASPPLVLCLSDYIRRMVLRHYDLPPHALPVLHNGVDLQKFNPHAPAPPGAAPPWPADFARGGIVGLMVAQDFRRKGLATAIEALAMAADGQLRLVVVGRDDPAPYRRLARRRGVEHRVFFAGAVSDARICYRRADFLILPTRHDPCSLVVLEALAMGLPVITTVFNGAGELVTGGRHGFVLNDPADAHALASAMRAMLDSAARHRMREACLELRPALSQQHHVESLLGIYRRVAAGDRSA